MPNSLIWESSFYQLGSPTAMSDALYLMASLYLRYKMLFWTDWRQVSRWIKPLPGPERVNNVSHRMEKLCRIYEFVTTVLGFVPSVQCLKSLDSYDLGLWPCFFFPHRWFKFSFPTVWCFAKARSATCIEAGDKSDAHKRLAHRNRFPSLFLSIYNLDIVLSHFTAEVLSLLVFLSFSGWYFCSSLSCSACFSFNLLIVPFPPGIQYQ